MKINEFSLNILGGEEDIYRQGYVFLSHNQIYSLQLKNEGSTDCDAEVFVDGDSVGTFRIKSHNSIVLERPSHVDRKFTFYKLNTKEADAAELSLVGAADLGLIKVIFTPAKVVLTRSYEPDYASFEGSRGLTYGAFGMSKSFGGVTRGASPGGTGLSEYSSQRFVEASRLDYDYTLQTTINLRLVAKTEESIIPLKSRRQSSNQIPKALI